MGLAACAARVGVFRTSQGIGLVEGIERLHLAINGFSASNVGLDQFNRGKFPRSEQAGQFGDGFVE